jgi:F0F1-type ATP synthase epsilon subunit
MGEITILDKHEPLISILAPGTIKIVDENKKEWYIPVRSGFLKVSPDNQIKILVEGDDSGTDR